MRVLIFISAFAILICFGALMWVLAKYKHDEELKKEPKNKKPYVDV